MCEIEPSFNLKIIRTILLDLPFFTILIAYAVVITFKLENMRSAVPEDSLFFYLKRFLEIIFNQLKFYSSDWYINKNMN